MKVLFKPKPKLTPKAETAIIKKPDLNNKDLITMLRGYTLNYLPKKKLPAKPLLLFLLRV
jgi:hypothetical protein